MFSMKYHRIYSDGLACNGGAVLYTMDSPESK